VRLFKIIFDFSLLLDSKVLLSGDSFKFFSFVLLIGDSSSFFSEDGLTGVSIDVDGVVDLFSSCCCSFDILFSFFSLLF